MQKHTPGPYWLRTNANGSHDVCGRHGKTIRTYPADQIMMAGADVQKLQRLFKASEMALQEAAPDMLEALRAAVCAVEQLCHGQDTDNQCWVTLATVRAAIAKAEGR